MKKVKGQMSESLVLGLLLALAGGFFDAYTYLCRGGVFANAETGNIVLLGAHLAEGDLEKALRYLLPIVAFAFGVLSAELVKRRFKSRQNRDINIHWRQIVVLGEMVLVTIAALLPQSANAMVNIIISFVCAMQVQTFRKVNGYTIASTMCIGNIRSEIESLSAYLKTHNHKLLDQTYRYLGIVVIFALGAGTGFKLAESLAYHTIWVCCLLLMVSFVLMLIPADEFVLPKDIPEGDYLYGGRK